jgi:hypothetical protein
MDLFIWKFILKLNWTKIEKLANHLVLIKKLELYFLKNFFVMHILIVFYLIRKISFNFEPKENRIYAKIISLV